MKNNIFIPERINVGFQKRTDTYSGKLSFIVYFDNAGVLRKEKSWEGWRDKTIPNEIYENKPMSGFVLNKKAGGTSSHWNVRQTYVRVFDPRGFELELTVPNLLYILENTNSIKGKGLEGEFVYGYSGTDLILISTDSPDYKELVSFNDKLRTKESIKSKDLVAGVTYLNKKNQEMIYMGCFDCWQFKYERAADYRSDYKLKNCGKHFIFAQKDDSKYNDYGYNFTPFKSVSGKFMDVVSEECVVNFAEIFELMESKAWYSPVVEKAEKIRPMTFEEFEKQIEKGYYYRFMDALGQETEAVYVDGIEGKYGSLQLAFETLKPYKRARYLQNGKEEKGS